MAGHKIYCFNPADPTSHRINPIDGIRKAPEVLKTQAAEKLADLVIMNGESSEQKTEQTWNRSEKLLLYLCCYMPQQETQNKGILAHCVGSCYRDRTA